jgi:hypothetical protein
MKYSLINVYGTSSTGKVWGSWLKDHTGNLKSANEAANAIEHVNSGRINVAIVDAVNSAVPALGIFHDLQNLRTK